MSFNINEKVMSSVWKPCYKVVFSNIDLSIELLQDNLGFHRIVFRSVNESLLITSHKTYEY